MIADLGSSRARRVVGLGIACLLSWQAVGILPASSHVSACCCLRMQAEKKRCPVCAHAQEIQSGHPRLKTCSMHDATSLPLALVLPVLPGAVSALPQVEKQPLPQHQRAPLIPAPIPDVPTPPPLA